MKNELKIADANCSMIDRAHRVGDKVGQKPRNIVVKLSSTHSKDKIFKNVRNLAGKRHAGVEEQLPAEMQERRKRLWPLFKEAKEKAKNDSSMKVSWSLDKLKINGKLYQAKDDLQCLNANELPTSQIKIAQSQKRFDTGSSFQGHAAQLSRNVPVAAVLAQLFQNRSIASAEHNIYAYRTGNGPNIKESCSDDGEHGAGHRLLKMLREESATDVVVICTRWFRGTHIGPKRFNHIIECSKEALSHLN